MAKFPQDDSALDLTQREHFEQERRAVVQPIPTEDALVLEPAAVELPPCPRRPTSELQAHPWSAAETARWRCAPR
jgi:hypothetical protein